jgi:5'-phosphate synthase pdxT subunit
MSRANLPGYVDLHRFRDVAEFREMIAVERNAYGRQIDSRVVELDPEPDFLNRTAPGKLEAVFIRAPIIRRVHHGVKLLAQYEGDPVLIEGGRHLVATFHPELTRDTRVHSLFLEKL